MSLRTLAAGAVVLIAGLAVAGSAVYAADTPRQNSESIAIDESIAGYTAAYNKADIKSLATFWAMESDFVE